MATFTEAINNLDRIAASLENAIAHHDHFEKLRNVLNQAYQDGEMSHKKYLEVSESAVSNYAELCAANRRSR